MTSDPHGFDFRILGPLEVLRGGRPVRIAGHKQRALLASLVLHANEVVSPDRLIDDLWGDAPPPTAAKTLQAHLSRLRRVLDGDEAERDGGPIETRGAGYVLHVEHGELDADRFQDLLDDARGALARGDPGDAARAAAAALALWRGPPLADFAYDAFAQADITRLTDLRLAAEEERIEAELELGNHRSLVGPLERLVAQHRFRERLRGQLMLALYRCDRQTEALEVYAQGRRALAGEVGLEPSRTLQELELRILQHDPALAPARPVTPAATAPRPRVRVAVGAALVVLLGLTVLILQLRGGGSAAADRRPPSFVDGGVALLDPADGRVVGDVRAGTAPSNLVADDEGVWVIDAEDRTLTRIDARARTVRRTLSTGATPTTIAVGAGSVWVGNASRVPEFAGTSYPESVSRLDARSGAVRATIALPPAPARSYFQGGGLEQQLLAASDDAVWAIGPDRAVSRIDPQTNRVVATVAHVHATGVAVGEGQVWVIAEPGLVQIDPATNTVARRIEVSAEALAAIAVGGGAVWAADPLGGSVWRIDTTREHLMRTIPAGVGVGWVAYADGAVWATNEVSGEVHRIDAATNTSRVVARMSAPNGVAVAGDAVWVSHAPAASDDAVLPTTACGAVEHGPAGTPQVVVVSDLPLQGPVRDTTAPMVEAIRLVLERRGFRAGRFTVGFASCDASTAQAGGTDAFRCFANGRAYARAPNVVGVIGAFHSFCSMLEIPVANQAPAGPLAMVSPSNTVTTLTRPHTGEDAQRSARLYPTGVRNYVRLAASDRAAAAALAEAARQLGGRRVVVLSDRDDGYAAGFAADVRDGVAARGLALADLTTWNPTDVGFGALAGRVASARPDAVVLVGAAPPQVDALLRDLRAGLGAGVPMIASAGFAGVAGPSARGLYIATYGIPNSKLPPAGRRFLAELESRTGSAGPDFSAIYGAQAAELMLDAIARSDGTRASVAAELRRTSVRDGLLGEVRFDRFGDLVDPPVSLYRLTDDDAELDRVLTVRSDG
jgi:DNA-binding SARP family transcriptional activator/ABC-type branched-subunit amino acid transport system substrate-binding protein